jgi:hypothetical protein
MAERHVAKRRDFERELVPFSLRHIEPPEVRVIRIAGGHADYFEIAVGECRKPVAFEAARAA